jgi:Rrf2 family protein
LHLLLHIARAEKPLTSEALALSLNTNQVVVRRMLAGLREHGHVQSEKGHGGGWSLTRPLAAISLLDVHEALGSPTPFAIELSHDHPTCLLERAAHDALRDALAEAEQTLRARLAGVTLADLASEAAAQMPWHGQGHAGKKRSKPKRAERAQRS